MRSVALILLFFTLGFTGHKFYVSNTLIHHNAQSQNFEITMKIFTDDLERAIESKRQEKLRLGDEDREHTLANEWIGDYLLDRFSVSLDDKPCALQFLGKEVDYEMTYCYLEIHNVVDFHSLSIRNEALLELFPEQQNIVDIDFQGWKQRILLDNNHSTKQVAR